MLFLRRCLKIEITDKINILNIDTSTISKYLINESIIKNFPIKDFTEDKIKIAINAGIEISWKESNDLTVKNMNNRALFINAKGAITKICINNLYVNHKKLLDILLELCDAIIYLSPIALIRMIKSIFEVLQVSLTNDEIFVFWCIYNNIDKYYITEENLRILLKKASIDNSYDTLSEIKIKNIIEHLLYINIIKKDNYRYLISEKIIVNWK